MDEFHAKNFVKEGTCFKNIDNPSCIDLFLINTWRSFQNTITVSTGLSDFHKMIITVLKTTFPKAKPTVITYRDYSKFVKEDFNQKLASDVKDYETLENIFLGIYNTLKKQKIYCNRHSKRERRNYYLQLRLDNITG